MSSLYLLLKRQPLVSLSAFASRMPLASYTVQAWAPIYNPLTAQLSSLGCTEQLSNKIWQLHLRHKQLHSWSWAQSIIPSEDQVLLLQPQRGITSETELAEQLEKIQRGPDTLQKQNHLNRSQQWEVIEFLPDASYKAIMLSPKSARLDPRDVSLFAERRGYSNQRATLTPREGAILFRTEIARAIIRADRALVFASRREKDTLKIVQAMYSGIASADAAVPFEFRVLESLLAETVRQFERHHKRLLLLSDSVEREIQLVLKTSSGDLTRLLPIQKNLTEMRQDVVETRDAVKEVLDSDKLLAGLCLTERAQDSQDSVYADFPQKSTEAMREAALLLESYERQISTVEGALKEKQDYLEVVREVWAMQLDATRNRIIRIDLIVAIASFALILPTVPAAFFGMNLDSGLEDSPGVFWPVVIMSLSAASLAFLAVYSYWRYFPNSRAQKRINDVRALHDLLSHHIDDLEDVMAALRDSYGPHAGCPEGTNGSGKTSLGKKEFTQLVRRTIHQRQVSDQEVDLLYRVFDTNRDGFLNLAEIVWNETKVRNSDAMSLKM